ncbi:MAG: outer rane efflux protein [Gemmatimonadetes bacterium]|nr:outer rane efflux protein [Gemmatimonadota bacterium]
MRFRIALIAACAVRAAPMIAQAPITRADAVNTAIERGPRLAVARADTAVATAALLTARALPNPTLNAAYSAAVPNHHLTVDVPIDFPWLRQLRVRSAQLGVQAAQYRYQFARAMIALDADTTYTRAIASRERVALSRRNALDADSLLHMVERRRDAGDASDMDVELARVNAGQQANIATSDSLTWLSALLDLQAVLGLAGRQLEIRAVDSLTAPPEAVMPTQATLSEAAAGVSLESAGLTSQLQRRSVWSSFTVIAGFEQGDPGQPGLLPTVGIGVGLPIFNRNRGPIAQADAERARAAADLLLAQVEARNQIAHASRERENALARVARDRIVVASAERVVAMSLTAYREGASSLPNVLQAQRTARDVLAQYIDDLALAWIATAELRVLATPPSPSTLP